jgi:hypothetical protein
MTALHKHWSMLAGILCGFIMLPVFLVEYQRWSDQRHLAAQQAQSVITTTVRVLERDEYTATLEVQGIKHRQCEYVGMSALTFDATARSDTTVAQRVDRELLGVTRPIGPFYAGIWRVTVRPDQRAMLEALYRCEGVPVRSTFATLDAMADAWPE